MIVFQEGATKAQEDEAHGILECLTVAYPGYPWAVRVYDGGFFVRHLDYPAGWGMNCKHPEFGYSASAMKRKVILMAGEWLERAKLKRGRSNDDEPGYIEGIPAKDQLAKPPLAVTDVVDGGSRNTVRPEVMQAVKDMSNGLS